MAIVEVVAAVALSFLAPGKKLNWPEATVVMFSREVEKILKKLVNLELVATDGVHYWLTEAGKQFFTKVLEQQGNLFREFSSIIDKTCQLQSPRWWIPHERKAPNPGPQADS